MPASPIHRYQGKLTGDTPLRLSDYLSDAAAVLDGETVLVERTMPGNRLHARRLVAGTRPAGQGHALMSATERGPVNGADRARDRLA